MTAYCVPKGFIHSDCVSKNLLSSLKQLKFCTPSKFCLTENVRRTKVSISLYWVRDLICYNIGKVGKFTCLAWEMGKPVIKERMIW